MNKYLNAIHVTYMLFLVTVSATVLSMEGPAKTPTTTNPFETTIRAESNTPGASPATAKPTLTETAYKALASMAKTAYDAPGKFMNYWGLSNAENGTIITGPKDSVAAVIGYQADASSTNPGWNFTTLGTKINDNLKSQMNQGTPGIIERLDGNGNGTRITTPGDGSKPTIEYLLNNTTMAQQKLNPKTQKIEIIDTSTNQPMTQTYFVNNELENQIATAKKAAAATTTLSVAKNFRGEIISPAPQSYLGAAIDTTRAVYHTPGAIAQTLGGTRNGNFITEASVKNVTRGVTNALVATPGLAVTAAKGLGKGAITAAGVTGAGLVAGAYYGGKAVAKGAIQGAHYAIEAAPGALTLAQQAIDATRQTIWSGNLAKASAAVGNALAPAQSGAQ